MTSCVGPPAGTITQTTLGEGSASTSSARLVDVGDVGVVVVADDGVAGVAETGPHVAAHLAEADESDFHADPPMLVGRCRRSGEQAARHQQVAERRVVTVLPSSPIEPLITTGLEAWVKASSTTASSMAVRPSRRNCGLKPVVRSSPSMVASIDSEACASSPEPASRVEHAVGERQLHRGVALGDQRDALDGLDQGELVDQGLGQVLGREQAADLGELAVEQPGRRTTGAAGRGALEADDALAGAASPTARW